MKDNQTFYLDDKPASQFTTLNDICIFCVMTLVKNYSIPGHLSIVTCYVMLALFSEISPDNSLNFL